MAFAVVVLIIWLSLMLPLASFTATTASPSSSRYSFCMPSNFCRTSSAFASVGNAMILWSRGPYVACWHFSEVAALTRDVRCWGKIGSRFSGQSGPLLTQAV